MYPNFYFFFKDLFGIEIWGLSVVNMFGFFVAMSFLAALHFMTVELKRKEKEGLITGKKEIKTFGKLPSITEYVSNAALAFIFGYKFIFLITNAQTLSPDIQSHLFTSEGSMIWGLALAALSVGLKYLEAQKIKKQYPQPVQKETIIHPYQHMGTLTLLAAAVGLPGAKLFDSMERWSDFIKNPIQDFLNPFSGLTFYGGLICGGAAVLWYAHKKGIHWRHMLDVGGPAMMMAYAVGRIGCHMSGDGDWGIINNRPNPGFLPDWLWAYTYPNNVANTTDPIDKVPYLGDGIPVLEFPVWPTPIYETIIGLAFFGILWYYRKRIKTPGILFSLYLFLTGFERFWIEKIRTNVDLDILRMKITQATLISVALMISAVGLYFWFSKNKTIKEAELPIIESES